MAGCGLSEKVTFELEKVKRNHSCNGMRRIVQAQVKSKSKVQSMKKLGLNSWLPDGHEFANIKLIFISIHLIELIWLLL